MEKSPSASGVSRQPAALGLRPWLRHFIRGARAALPRLSSWAIPSTTRTGRSLQPRVIGSRGLMTVTICLEDVTDRRLSTLSGAGRATFSHLYRPLTSPAHNWVWNGVSGWPTVCLCVPVMLSGLPSLISSFLCLSVSPSLSPPPPHDCFLTLPVPSLVSGRLPSDLPHFLTPS